MNQCQHYLNGQQNIKICLNNKDCNQIGIFCEQCTNIHNNCQRYIYSLEEFKTLIERYQIQYEQKKQELNKFLNQLRDLIYTFNSQLGDLQKKNDYYEPQFLQFNTQYQFLQKPYDYNQIEFLFKYYTVLDQFIQETWNQGEQTQIELEQAFRKYQTNSLQKKMKIINLAYILDNENSIQNKQPKIEEELEQNKNIIEQLDNKLHMIEQSDFIQLPLSQLSQKNDDQQIIKYISILQGGDIIVVRKNNIIFFNQESLKQIDTINDLSIDQEYTSFINKNEEEESSFYLIVDKILIQGWKKQIENHTWKKYIERDFKKFTMQKVSYDQSSKKIITINLKISLIFEIYDKRKQKFEKQVVDGIKLRKSATCLFIHDENLIFIGGLKSVHAIINQKKKVSLQNIQENVTAIYYHNKYVIVGTKMRILLFEYQQQQNNFKFLKVYDCEANVLYIAPFLNKILINVIFFKPLEDKVNKHSIYQNYLLDIENRNEQPIQQENTYNINNQIKLIQKDKDTTFIFQVIKNPLKILYD